jgi:hypothetical protein
MYALQAPVACAAGVRTRVAARARCAAAAAAAAPLAARSAARGAALRVAPPPARAVRAHRTRATVDVVPTRVTDVTQGRIVVLGGCALSQPPLRFAPS